MRRAGSSPRSSCRKGCRERHLQIHGRQDELSVHCRDRERGSPALNRAPVSAEHALDGFSSIERPRKLICFGLYFKNLPYPACTQWGQVAQLVEHMTENHGVGGSIPSLATNLLTIQRVSIYRFSWGNGGNNRTGVATWPLQIHHEEAPYATRAPRAACPRR